MSKERPADAAKPARTLRERAEEMLRASAADVAGMPTEDVLRLVHELQIHQMELEIQNEDLRGTQIELAHSRDRYSDLFEFAPVGYLTLGRQGVIQEANVTAAEMLGVGKKHLIDRKLSEVVAGESQETWHLHRREVFSSDAKRTCELTMNPADGTPIAVRLESCSFRDEDGNVGQCRTALINVTTVKDTRRKLEESEQRYRRLMDAVTDYIYHVRVEHRRAVETMHGANCEAVTGYPPEDFRANPLLWIAMVPPEDRAVVKRQVNCILSNQNAPPIEHRIQRKDGTIRWALNTVSPQRDEQGHLIAYDGLLRDITERKNAEEALRHFNDELEQRVDARTAELRIIGTGREVVGQRRDGTTFPADLSVSEVDELGLFTGVVRDISERKQLQWDVLRIAEDEQRRIGQDLHDSTQQELAGLGMLAQTLLDNLGKESNELAAAGMPQPTELATKIVNGITRTHQEVQTISRGLVPIRLDAQGFMDALRELAARTDDLTGVSCALKCEQPVEVSDGLTTTHLYRIAQEAITNSLKHARPEHILITLETDHGQTLLSVADDGTGFDTTQASEGMGLKTMAYRASLIGANVTVKPVEAGGTLVTCRVSPTGGV